MKRLFAVTLCLLLLSGTAAAKREKTAEFTGTMEQVFDATVKAAQKNWSVRTIDRKTSVISFTTGTSVTTWGMDCSVLLSEVSPGKIRVTVTTQKKMQIYAWSAGDRIAKKLFKAIEVELKTPSPPKEN